MTGQDKVICILYSAFCIPYFPLSTHNNSSILKIIDMQTFALKKFFEEG